MPEPTVTDHWVEITPGGPVTGSIRPPGSKSLTNRALICAAFAAGRSKLTGALRSEDTEVMIEALRAIGVKIDVTAGGRILEVDPTSCVNQNDAVELYIANSGTTVRFLTAALSAFGGNYLMHGVPRMHERPIGDLITSIGTVIDGAIEATSPGGCPPVVIRSTGWNGRRVDVAGNVSSQYLSGLMLAAPIALSSAGRESITIEVCGELVSKPYVEMTAKVMRAFGADVQLRESNSVIIAADSYQGIEYAIEPDASAASYFWAMAAITGGTITVDGLSKTALQGDVAFCDILQQMGCQVRYDAEAVTVTGDALTGVDVDMNAISDTVQTLAVVALFADGPTRIRGVAHNRFKETDRIGDLACELRKLDAIVDEHDDGMTITPAKLGVGNRGAVLETYHDHRMAMSLSLAGLKRSGIRIMNPACTSKTYPEFFADLERLIGRPHRWA